MNKIRPQTQIMPAGSPLQLMRINAAGTALEFVTPSSVVGVTAVQDGGVAQTARPTLNFIDGAGATVTLADDAANNRTNITVAANVQSVSGRTGTVTLTAADVGAGTFPSGTFNFPGTLQQAGSQVYTPANPPFYQTTRKAGTAVTQRPSLNFIDGSNVSVTVADDAANTRTNVTIAATVPTAGHAIQEEGSGLTQRAALNFIGAGVTAADDAANNRTNVTITANVTSVATRTGAVTLTAADIAAGTYPSGTFNYPGTLQEGGNRVYSAGNPPFYQTVKKGGVAATQRGALNLIEGSNVTITAVDNSGSGQTDVTIAATASSPGHTIQEEGTPLTARTGLNFIGAGVTATDDAANNRTNVTITANVASVAGQTGTVTLTLADIGAGTSPAGTFNFNGTLQEAGNRVYSSGNPPPYPVTSVATRTGAITLTAADIAAGTFGNGTFIYPGTAQVGTGSNGRITLQSGNTVSSGYTEFVSAGGVRQGYIGFSTTTASADTGTIPYVAGTHAFTGAVTTTSTLSSGTNSVTGAVFLNGAAGSTRGVLHQTAGVSRWYAGVNAVAETGGNAGGDYGIFGYNDAGTLLGAYLMIARATGLVTVAAGLTASSGVSLGTGSQSGAGIHGDGTNVYLEAATTAAHVYLRPNGPGSNTGMADFATTGVTLSVPLLNVTGAAASLKLDGTSNSNIEIGRTDGVASTPFIDFHSGATAVDYDARFIASGGNGSAGNGSIGVDAAVLNVQNGAGTSQLQERGQRVFSPNNRNLSGAAGGALSFGTAGVAGSGTSYPASDHTHTLPSVYYQQAQKAGVAATQRNAFNLIEGSGVTITVADNAGSNRTDITIAASGGGAVSSVAGRTGAVVLTAADIGTGTFPGTYDYVNTQTTTMVGVNSTFGDIPTAQAIVLQNTTAATAGAPNSVPPAIRFGGRSWSGAASATWTADLYATATANQVARLNWSGLGGIRATDFQDTNGVSLPRGRVAGSGALRATQVIATTTETFLTNAANISFTSVPNRRYRVTGVLVVKDGTAGTAATIRVRDGLGSAPTSGSTALAGHRQEMTTANAGYSVNINFEIKDATATAHNLGLSATQTSANSMTMGDATWASQLTVEDIGT